MITLATELARIHGISPNFLANLEKLGIRTVRDLLWHFPFRYDDFSLTVPIAELAAGQRATVHGVIRRTDLRRTWRRRMTLVETVVEDETGAVKAIWFNQPYLAKILRPGVRANLAGKVSAEDEGLFLSNPSYEIVRAADDLKHTGGLIPVYPETRGLTSRGLRYLVKPLLKVLGVVPDFIPPPVLRREGFPPLAEALRGVHFPRTLGEAERAKKRFAFENLFLLHFNNLKLRESLSKASAPPIVLSPEDLRELQRRLPFTLTAPQDRSLEEILRDLARPHPMNRLLQGDVGSGKTVVAAIAALAAARAGTQAVFMAPTEILARQHYGTLVRTFGKLANEWGIGVGLITGSESAFFSGAGEERGKGKTRRPALLKAIAEERVRLVVGTQALIADTPPFPALAFAVIDEQHRFGVEQRAKLARQGAHLPHFLSMSATPIPRTLALTLFGDLDLSLIDELPAGRKPVVTKVVAPENREKAYAFIREQVENGRQAFVICPRIEPPTNADSAPISADSGSANMEIFPRQSASRLRQSALWDVKAVTEEYEKLSRRVFPDLKIGMLHGKMKNGEKGGTMAAFREGALDILVSTSVVEVGVDIPNAAIMVIEGAERFGLSQLYQFRGRIGRGEHQSFCFLFTESKSETAERRLQALLAAKNGFELAEQDLAIRGPGEFLGDRQTGLPDLAMRSLGNVELIKRSRDAAAKLFEESPALAAYPLLREKLAVFQKTIHLE